MSEQCSQCRRDLLPGSKRRYCSFACGRRGAPIVGTERETGEIFRAGRACRRRFSGQVPDHPKQLKPTSTVPARTPWPELTDLDRERFESRMHGTPADFATPLTASCAVLIRLAYSRSGFVTMCRLNGRSRPKEYVQC
jgi:hypothetical protein